MNTKKVKALVIMLVISLVLSIASVVNAFSTTGTLTSSTTKLVEGETVTISFNLSNIDAGEGLQSMEATLDYDSNVFEALAATGVTGSNGWNVTYEPTTKRVAGELDSTAKMKTNGTIATITLKAKSTISVNSTTVKLSEIIVSGGSVATGGTGDIEVSDAMVTLTKPAAPAPSTTPSKTTPSTDKTISEKQIPQTGVNYTAVAIMAVVAVIGIICLVRYIVYKKNTIG